MATLTDIENQSIVQKIITNWPKWSLNEKMGSTCFVSFLALIGVFTIIELGTFQCIKPCIHTPHDCSEYCITMFTMMKFCMYGILALVLFGLLLCCGVVPKVESCGVHWTTCT